MNVVGVVGKATLWPTWPTWPSIGGFASDVRNIYAALPVLDVRQIAVLEDFVLAQSAVIR